jgi:hypothetical protein
LRRFKLSGYKDHLLNNQFSKIRLDKLALKLLNYELYLNDEKWSFGMGRTRKESLRQSRSLN